jgi:xylan 1,4-beta-xylosidase
MTDSVPRGWTSDNGNGTFSNPLFYDEFSDPDMIRVGDNFYLTGTTNHVMPGLPILHSHDLVNWRHLTYAFDRLDLGPEFRLEDGKEVYGQGIWAPCFRYHNGTFYIFTNVNKQTTQLFRATNPAGPWTRTAMQCSLHDLSVLFDDDGAVYVIWGYQDVRFARLNADLTDIVPGSERILIARDTGMGEGVHFYKVDGTYYITSAWFSGRMRMPCARAGNPEGPYEVNLEISADEDFGLAEGARLLHREGGPPFKVVPPDPARVGRMSMHQGGIIDTPAGEWWGFSMMDYNSVGRLTCLSPITWQDGWPYFGLPGNLKRTPRIWTKPNTGHTAQPSAPYERDDDFSTPALKPIWQWNHAPDDRYWSVAERPGFLRLHALPAGDLLAARNTITQRSIGPVSSPAVRLDVSGMEAGCVAGLALLNLPYAWIGVRRESDGFVVEQLDQSSGEPVRVPLATPQVWLRAHCDFLTEQATFDYSTDGVTFQPLGGTFAMIFQLKTFQGVRYALFHYTTGGTPAGYADFTDFAVDQPYPRGLMKPVPFGKQIRLENVGTEMILTAQDGILSAVPAGDPAARSAAARFDVVDRGLGRVALRSGTAYVSVTAPGGAGQVTLRHGGPGDAETFQWTETAYGDLILLSLASHRHLRIDPASGAISADHPGPASDRRDGSCFMWNVDR